ncbi:hypothetical protein LTS18_003580 [Coniosporium uncinatum]|uniref:Uncharacterized protein n=1 Tax=Coniosporium uncinatum TaxID=93489 RepID=A0ACC3DTQ8_9PEZI|nr:hypothetical protein LTS18_003580 [Coniosporium uncinatum]
MDPMIYPSPHQFNPGRFIDGDSVVERKREQQTFLGWGAGVHPCMGVTFAKLENKITHALFIAVFDFELCKADGSPAEVGEQPSTDANGTAAMKPKKRVWLKYRVRGKR